MTSPKVYVPRVDSFTGEASMELWIPNERKYVRLEDFEEEQKRNAQARSLMTTDIADVRLNETKLSMKMSRLLKFISQQLHLSENSDAYCTCPRCDVLLKIRDVLNTEPPIKAGTQPVKGLSLISDWPHNLPLERLKDIADPFPIPPSVVEAINAAKDAPTPKLHPDDIGSPPGETT